MKKLTTEQFNKAAQFLKTQAQDIDRAMFEHFFEDKPLEKVVDILVTYQNEDGGFGKLDYDFEYPYSCLKHTESACRYIFALKEIPAEHPMIKKLITYIVENYNRVSGEWDNLTVPAVNDYPYAPWWGYGEKETFIPKDRSELIEHYNPNTHSALAGMLVKYSSLVPKEIQDEVTGIVIDKINSGYAFGQYGMMSDIYFVNALKNENLKNNLLETLMGDGKLISLLDENLGTENAYKLCHWIDVPEHLYFPMYEDAVQKNFELLINSQEADGSWSPSWSWGELDVWERVVLRLKGVLTFKFLWTMKKFGCIIQREPIRLSNIRPLIDGMKGHNYALPDCMKFIFERAGAYENLGFWDIAAVTGDTAALVYNHLPTTSCEYCVSGYLAGPGHIAYVFDAFGYEHEYISADSFDANMPHYLQKITGFINKGIPVLVKTNLNDIPAWKSDVGTFCLLTGYDPDKNIVELLVADTTPIQYELSDKNKLDLIFIGKKKRDIPLDEIYLNAIKKMPYWLTLPERSGMFFGASAYREWADDIEKGRYADTALPLWGNYGVYVANIATSGGEPTFIYSKLAGLNPATYSDFASIGEKIQTLLPAESPTGGRCKLWIQLEDLGGGMDMNAVRETMRDTGKRSLIADALRDYANRLDQVVGLMMDV